jgi:hypothetical protein
MNLLRPTWAKALGLALVVVPALALPACDLLDQDPYSEIPADQFFNNEEEVLAALAPIYAQLRQLLANNHYFGVSQVSSDETIVPTRGPDWGDGGLWLRLQFHEWSAQHGFLNDIWTASNTGIARANGVLSSLETADVPNKEILNAEVRALRAFYYYTLLDMFGRVPLIGDEEGEFLPDPNDLPPAEDRAAVFAFVERELLEAREVLDPQSLQLGRMGSDAIDAMLASLYLNAEVFGGEVTGAGLQRGPARWQEAYDYADGLINSGRYQLDPNFFDVFAVNNEGNAEHIMVVQQVAVSGLGGGFPNMALHYNSTPSGAWNGFSALADTYLAYEGDPRQAMYLEGEQVDLITGEPACLRPSCEQGAPRLNFTLTFDNATGEGEDVTNAEEYAGVRPNKFPPDPNESGTFGHGNDFAFFRLGEMYLIRAEAAYNLGNTGQALADVNTIRERAGAEPLTSISRELILRERLLELGWEAKRRQDLIRTDESTDFGTGSGNLWTRGWDFKEPSEPYRVVFPIPQAQLNANPALIQNAGY